MLDGIKERAKSWSIRLPFLFINPIVIAYSCLLVENCISLIEQDFGGVIWRLAGCIEIRGGKCGQGARGKCVNARPDPGLAKQGKSLAAKSCWASSIVTMSGKHR